MINTKSSVSNLLFLSCICLSMLLASCRNDDETTDCDTYEWEYTGVTAPETWQLCSAECGGQAQSPVDIAGAIPDANLVALTTDYQDTPINLEYNGKDVKFNYEAGSTLNVNGTDYELLQFHFHGLSEHTVGGQQYPLEVHLVHQSAAGDLAVIGVFFEIGAENDFLANFEGNLPDTDGATYTSADLVNITDVLPTDTGYYTYSGSLTTPPCNEIVTWLVMKSSVEASSNQIQELQDILNNNFRPIQGLNGREIMEFE